jgi:hypothetical protein
MNRQDAKIAKAIPRPALVVDEHSNHRTLERPNAFEVSAMGRTVLPFNQVLEQAFRNWAKFRRALRKEDQEAFDALFGAAKYHVAPASYASQLNPTEAIFLSILLEHQKALDALTARLAEAPSGEATSRAPQTTNDQDALNG